MNNAHWVLLAAEFENGVRLETHCKDNEAFTPHWEESLSIRVIGDEEKVNEWLRMADY